MAITAANFRSNFPEFASTSAFPETAVAFWLGAADAILSKTRWGTTREMALQLYAAHNISLEAQAWRTAAKGGVPGAATGAVNSKSVGPASIGFDTASSAADMAGHYNSTIYGQRLWALIQIFGAGPIQVGVGCAPRWLGNLFTGAAWPGPAPWV